MRELIDCHVHTARCGHAIGSCAEYVSAAKHRGLTALMLSEHLPLPEGLDPRACYAMPAGSVESYVHEVRAAAAAHDLDVIVGAEADWVPDRAEETAAIRNDARSAGVAVLLGSVHFLDGWAFDDPDLITEWDSRRVDDVWRDYFRVWCEAAASGEFDVMAHPDLVKKFGHRPQQDPTSWYREAAEAAIAGGVVIEVSTAGLRKPVGELYPSPDLLREFRRAGVPATVGSDAHRPDDVGYQLGAAFDALVDAGYERYVLPMGRGSRREFTL